MTFLDQQGNQQDGWRYGTVPKSHSATEGESEMKHTTDWVKVASSPRALLLHIEL
jgi:hypothetical protein